MQGRGTGPGRHTPVPQQFAYQAAAIPPMMQMSFMPVPISQLGLSPTEMLYNMTGTLPQQQSLSQSSENDDQQMNAAAGDSDWDPNDASGDDDDDDSQRPKRKRKRSGSDSKDSAEKPAKREKKADDDAEQSANDSVDKAVKGATYGEAELKELLKLRVERDADFQKNKTRPKECWERLAQDLAAKTKLPLREAESVKKRWAKASGDYSAWRAAVHKAKAAEQDPPKQAWWMEIVAPLLSTAAHINPPAMVMVGSVGDKPKEIQREEAVEAGSAAAPAAEADSSSSSSSSSSAQQQPAKPAAPKAEASAESGKQKKKKKKDKTSSKPADDGDDSLPSKQAKRSNPMDTLSQALSKNPLTAAFKEMTTASSNDMKMLVTAISSLAPAPAVPASAAPPPWAQAMLQQMTTMQQQFNMFQAHLPMQQQQMNMFQGQPAPMQQQFQQPAPAQSAPMQFQPPAPQQFAAPFSPQSSSNSAARHQQHSSPHQ